MVPVGVYYIIIPKALECMRLKASRTRGVYGTEFLSCSGHSFCVAGRRVGGGLGGM